MTVVQNEHTAEAEESALVEQARAQNQLAWTQLIRQHQEPAFRLAYLMVGEARDAEDVLQEALLRAYLSLDKFDSTRPFRPWLLSIVANLARNRKRAIGRYWYMIQRWWQQRDPEAFSQPPTLKHESAALWAAVQQLPSAGQEVIYMRYFLGLSVEETAEALEIKTGTVKSRSSRALTQLRGIIEREFTELIDEE
ncbi:MAG: RNA polymerase sigma factor [Anaerolineales bacterium]|nr:RNA polymerase sigma factor [Anaerolineales bacterium]